MAEAPDQTDEMGAARISRRRLIQAGAVVAGAVWAAPAVDSFLTPAAAASVPAGGVNFGVSWVYVVYKDSLGAIRYTGWKGDTSTACNSNASYPKKKPDVPGSCGTNSFTLKGTQGAPPEIDYSVGTQSGTLSGTTDGCASFSYSGKDGKTIHALSGVEILAAFEFNGSVAKLVCPDSLGVGNTLTV